MTKARTAGAIEDLECYLVGGAVRDEILGIESSDQDWVVVGSDSATMQSLGFQAIGKDFPVYLHPQTHQEYALARRERKSGPGYKGFQVDVSQDVTLEEDLYRRDLTINAMARAGDGTLIDPFGGQSDLENGLLRHVSDHFIEDPLRVLRVARFSARYYRRGFIVHDSTLEMMRAITHSGELDHLVPERILQEVRNALSEHHPSVFFKTLRCCDALEALFPEINIVFDIRDRDIARRAMDAVDREFDDMPDFELRFAALAYFVGEAAKIRATHEESAGENSVYNFCKRIRVPAKLQLLAVQVCRLSDNVRSIHNLSVEDAVNMVRELNRTRHPEHFGKFLSACRMVLETQVHDSSRVGELLDMLLAIRECISRVDAQALSQEFSGDELKEKIRQAQIERVSEFLENAT